ncbi:hypothetical protein [uncultured Pelagimonas sp.]|uniref:hypothetical protein n=1 Tax=uncultured Pelagimonas sp. TaxID=1618102 RepID=UPI00262C660E|nr:hypothetical protein [uncultured Pelagimonas sp.]
MNSVIGALRAVLGMDSAAFTDGIGKAQKRVTSFRKSMEATGNKMQSIGRRMSLGITAPLVGLAGLSVASTRSMSELQDLANVAGISAKRFKVLSIAAKDFGIGQDKLSDILKDVNDKFGDYFQTGAGPLKDFFDNVAPKVGLTADAFKGLSSEEAMGKYVQALQDANLSQAEMTFYMEALASDSTMLLPLFKDNAAAIKEVSKRAEELGLTLNGKTIEAARAAGRDFGIVSEVLKTQLQSALVELVPVFADLARVAVPLLKKLVGFISSLATGFANLSPETQGFIAAGVGLAAVLGPLIAGAGLLATAMAPLAGVILAVVSPLGLLAAGAAAAAIAIYTHWDELKQKFPTITDGIEAAIGVLQAVFTRGFEAVKVFADGVITQVTLLFGAIEALISGDFSGFATKIAAMLQNAIKTVVAVLDVLFGDAVRATLEFGKKLLTSITTSVSGAATQAVAAIKQMALDIAAAIEAEIQNVVAAALKIGAAIIDGIKQGIKDGWAGIKDYIHSLAMELPEWIRKPLGIHSPSRVFAEIGGFIVDGLVQGLQGGQASIKSSADGLVGILRDTDMAGAFGEVDQAIEGIGDTAGDVFSALGDAIKGLIFEGKSLGEVLSNVFSSIASSGMSQAGSVFSGMAQNLVGSLFGGLPGFKTGGAFDVGGVGGMDSQLVAFRASPNERVRITTPAQEKAFANMGSGGGMNVVMNIQTPDVQGFQRSQPQIASDMSRMLNRAGRTR